MIPELPWNEVRERPKERYAKDHEDIKSQQLLLNIKLLHTYLECHEV